MMALFSRRFPWFYWRKVFWFYPSAAGGYAVFIFKRGFHDERID